MKRVFYLLSILAAASTALGTTNILELEASKDTFGRSNQRNQNNGGSPVLLIAYAPSIRSIVGFDLSGVTNEIVGAEFHVRMKNTEPGPVRVVVAPMAQTTNNAAWVEGGGSLGVRGPNARPGEVSFGMRAFRDQPWESAAGVALKGLADSALWEAPIATLENLAWTKDVWIKVPVGNIAWLEKTRASSAPVVTLGLWGTAKDGFFELYSKDGGHAPKLILTLKEMEE
ncbi:hypothetical protein PDESU_01510 [Pontiella desulfatans]|uniref:Uncharacterized protein n=1 Tax=Pontiella desulfatans TaxID=2750659 RepID=A0A6C2U0N8_PONDE|nr:hypothetical protein [Pontiella desulfatans]VGO12956.1 hypothetical protein PDESU_01510 [Pontiella desulfatans]